MKRRQRGLTLPELLTTLTIMVVVGAVAVPAINSLKEAFRGAGNARVIASTVLQNARAIAMNEGQYAGVRFQRDKTGRQYAIYIVYMPIGTGGFAEFNTMMYKAVEGKEPVPMPEGILLSDMVVRTNDSYLYTESGYKLLEEDDLANEKSLTDITSFSIIFDSSGQLVRKRIRVRNRDKIFRPDEEGRDSSKDKIFSSLANVEKLTSKFIQDDYGELGLGGELSRIQFKIFDVNEYNKLDSDQKKFEYLDSLPYYSVNQYSGELSSGNE